jgi:transcriptional regulator with XRE-family HTH domain
MAGKRDPDRSALALFADELRAARDRAGLSRDELGEQLNYSGSLVGMVETMKRVPQADFAARCDAVFDTTGTFARLQSRLRNLTFPASFRPFAAYEETATALRNFENMLIPGLLQTLGYARAVLASRPNTSTGELDDLVMARLARQAILDRDDPPLLWAVIDEMVLHRPVGDSKVMHDQLMHLVEASERPNITVQVLPCSVGAHSGLRGAFIIADFDDTPSIAFLETAAEGDTVEEPIMVAKVALIFDTLRSEALPRSASVDMIRKVAEERWT